MYWSEQSVDLMALHAVRVRKKKKLKRRHLLHRVADRPSFRTGFGRGNRRKTAQTACDLFETRVRRVPGQSSQPATDRISKACDRRPVAFQTDRFRRISRRKRRHQELARNGNAPIGPAAMPVQAKRPIGVVGVRRASRDTGLRVSVGELRFELTTRRTCRKTAEHKPPPFNVGFVCFGFRKSGIFERVRKERAFVWKQVKKKISDQKWSCNPSVIGTRPNQPGICIKIRGPHRETSCRLASSPPPPPPSGTYVGGRAYFFFFVMPS